MVITAVTTHITHAGDDVSAMLSHAACFTAAVVLNPLPACNWV